MGGAPEEQSRGTRHHDTVNLETEVDGTKGALTEAETESNEALSEWEEGRINDF